MNLQQRSPPVEGIFDLNIVLQFGKQWPEMKEFAYETRTQLFDLIYNIEHLGALVLGLLIGVLFTTVVFLAFSRRKQLATAAALLLTPLAVYAQPEPQVDLVTLKYVDKNFGSRIDGAGMCVFNSFRGSLLSQYRNDCEDYARWLADKFPGGGYPSRVTEYTRAYCRAKGIDDLEQDYVQIVGEDTIEAMEEALKDGRSPAFTYSGDPSFYGGPVPHMCNLVYADSRWWGVVDNNRPHMVEWVARETGIRRHRHYDKGWCIIYMGPPQLGRPVNGPIPPPRSREPQTPFQRVSLLLDDCAQCNNPRVQQRPDGYTWHKQSNGVWYLHDANNVRQGEYHESDGRYYTYRLGGGLIPSVNPFKDPSDNKSSDTPTGVLYGGFPELRRGQTLYGYGGNPIADRSNKLLFEERRGSDRRRARVVINGDSALETLVKQALQRLKSNALAYGREAIEAIMAQRYGQGVTILMNGKDGIMLDVGHFEGLPTDEQLAGALIKADESYRPNTVSQLVDSYGIALLAILGAMFVVYVYLAAQKPAAVNQEEVK